MEIQFAHKTIATYESFSQQSRRVQVEMEAVVPDVNEDVGRIVSVRSDVHLKSKDAFSGRITVSGELQAVVIYITEGEDQVSAVKLAKSFELDYEEEDFDQETISQITLRVLNTETRVLNPRKLSLTAELVGELSAYRESRSLVETRPEAEQEESLYVKEDQVRACFTDLVTEKTFALNEQLLFETGKPTPKQLLAENVSFRCSDPQQVGSRLILKGSAEIEVWYLAEELAYPQSVHFSLPFSQIADAGEAIFDFGQMLPVLTSSYFDLTDTISGEKALEVELHALMQLRGYCVQNLSYVSDAYSNRAPVEAMREKRRVLSGVHVHTELLNSTEAIPIGDDCAEILCTFAQVSQSSCAEGSLTLTLQLEILYATREGSLSCVKRSLNLSKAFPQSTDRMLSAQIRELDLMLDGDKAAVRVSAELQLESGEEREIEMLSTVELDLDEPYDVEAYPTLSLVRVDQESLWDLAKAFHSSIEAIEAMNELRGPLEGRILLVPKQI